MRVISNTLIVQNKTYRCAVGKNGFARDKKEGDGCTPVGTFALRECWYRADRLPAPETKLPLRIIGENDGWCDDVNSTQYNKYIRHPGEGRDPRQVSSQPMGVDASLRWHDSEKLWRTDHIYDLIIPLGYNDNPVVAGKGSAIFIHIAKPDYSGTEGCIAASQKDLLEILIHCDTSTTIEICHTRA